MAAAAGDAEVVARAQADDGRSPAQLIAAYREGPALLRQSISGMTREQLLAYPVPGKMSSQEVVCHVVDADQFLADRMKRTIATDLPLLVGVNGIAYLEALHYAERDLDLDFALLETTRAQMAADLERLDATCVGTHRHPHRDRARHAPRPDAPLDQAPRAALRRDRREAPRARHLSAGARPRHPPKGHPAHPVGS